MAFLSIENDTFVLHKLYLSLGGLSIICVKKDIIFSIKIYYLLYIRQV